jgi:hypothetical protein
LLGKNRQDFFTVLGNTIALYMQMQIKATLQPINAGNTIKGLSTVLGTVIALSMGRIL